MELSEVRLWARERREKLFVVLSVVLLVGMAGGALVVSAQSGGFVLDYTSEPAGWTVVGDVNDSAYAYHNVTTGTDAGFTARYNMTVDNAFDQGQNNFYIGFRFANNSSLVMNFLVEEEGTTNRDDRWAVYRCDNLVENCTTVVETRAHEIWNEQFYRHEPTFKYNATAGTWNVSLQTVGANSTGVSQSSLTATGVTGQPPSNITDVFYRHRDNNNPGYFELDTATGRVYSTAGGGGESVYGILECTDCGFAGSGTGGGSGVPQNERLELETRYYMQVHERERNDCERHAERRRGRANGRQPCYPPERSHQDAGRSHGRHAPSTAGRRTPVGASCTIHERVRRTRNRRGRGSHRVACGLHQSGHRNAVGVHGDVRRLELGREYRLRYQQGDVSMSLLGSLRRHGVWAAVAPIVADRVITLLYWRHESNANVESLGRIGWVALTALLVGLLVVVWYRMGVRQNVAARACVGLLCVSHVVVLVANVSVVVG